MYDKIGVDIIRELAEQTIFSKAALDKQDAQQPARPLARLINAFRRQDVANETDECNDPPRATNRLADGVARK